MTYNPKINYCTLIPNEIAGVNYNHKCYLHDEQYGGRVKVRKKRKQADYDLASRIYLRFCEHNKQKLGYIISLIVYSGTRLGGWIKWID